MSRQEARCSKTAARATTARPAEAPALDARRICREQADRILRALRQIVPALIREAKSGSYLHARFLFEFAGIAPASPEADAGPSLAALLLERLDLEAAPDAGSLPATAKR